MDLHDQLLRVLNAKRIRTRTVLARHATAMQPESGVWAIWMVAVAEREGAAQGADGVVVPLLAPVRVPVGDAVQGYMINLEEKLLAEFGAPEVVDDAVIVRNRRSCEVVTRQARFAVLEELIENLTALPKTSFAGLQSGDGF